MGTPRDLGVSITCIKDRELNKAIYLCQQIAWIYLSAW